MIRKTSNFSIDIRFANGLSFGGVQSCVFFEQIMIRASVRSSIYGGSPREL